MDPPIDWGALVAVLIVALAGVEVSPGTVQRKRGGHVGCECVEAEMIVFVDEHGHGPRGAHAAGLEDHAGDARRVLRAVAVEQQEVRGLNYVGGGNGASRKAGSGEETP